MIIKNNWSCLSEIIIDLLKTKLNNNRSIYNVNVANVIYYNVHFYIVI